MKHQQEIMNAQKLLSKKNDEMNVLKRNMEL